MIDKTSHCEDFMLRTRSRTLSHTFSILHHVIQCTKLPAVLLSCYQARLTLAIQAQNHTKASVTTCHGVQLYIPPCAQIPHTECNNTRTRCNATAATAAALAATRFRRCWQPEGAGCCAATAVPSRSGAARGARAAHRAGGQTPACARGEVTWCWRKDARVASR